MMQTQYIGNNFVRYQNGRHILLPRFSTGEWLFAPLKILLKSGFVPVISCAVIIASIVGYVAAINYSMLRGALLKQEQKEIKLVEISVLQKEISLANARTTALLKKQKEIALMENVDNVRYVSPNLSVAEALRDQIIR